MSGISIFPILLAHAQVVITNNPLDIASNPIEGIGNIYKIALQIGALLAFGQIAYASLRYAIAQGNPGEQSDAKERIQDALFSAL